MYIHVVHMHVYMYMYVMYYTLKNYDFKNSCLDVFPLTPFTLTHAHTHTHTCTHTHTHTQTHTHTHTHTHSQTEEQKLEAAEKYLEESATMFDEFLKENDKSAVEAIKQ